MSKEEFLRELEQRLHVLEEQERRDVLEEYAQHIDLKIESGQSQEEAVRDFGDPGELAAELLDVYHINSEYAAGTQVPGKEEKGDGRDGSPDGRVADRGDAPAGRTGSVPFPAALKRLPGKLFGMLAGGVKFLYGVCAALLGSLAGLCVKAGGTFRKAGIRLRGCFVKLWTRARKAFFGTCRWVWHALSGVFLGAARLVGKPFEKIRGERRKRKERKRMDGEHQEPVPGGPAFLRAASRCAGAFLLSLWKVCLFLMALPALFLGIAALFLGGAVLVLLLQGYPLVGIGIGTLGLGMSSFGIAALILSWVFTGEKESVAAAAPDGVADRAKGALPGGEGNGNRNEA